MAIEALAALKVDKLVDARGTACPGPLLEAKRALSECPVGGVMEIQSSDLDTVVSVQRWCTKMEFEYLGDLQGDGYWSIYLRRTK